jgi:hypothetical protein
MATLRIDFQDGFIDDSVVVRVGGQEVYRGANLRTSRLLGFAHTVSADVPAGRVMVEVEVPSRELSGSAALQVQDAAYLGVSIADDGISFTPSGGPFGYA